MSYGFNLTAKPSATETAGAWLTEKMPLCFNLTAKPSATKTADKRQTGFSRELQSYC